MTTPPAPPLPPPPPVTLEDLLRWGGLTPAGRIARALEARADGQAIRKGRCPVALTPTMASLARPVD